jgi:hypothetical protein
MLGTQAGTLGGGEVRLARRDVLPEGGEVNSLLVAAESVGADIKPASTESETKLIA